MCTRYYISFFNIFLTFWYRLITCVWILIMIEKCRNFYLEYFFKILYFVLYNYCISAHDRFSINFSNYHQAGVIISTIADIKGWLIWIECSSIIYIMYGIIYVMSNWILLLTTHVIKSVVYMLLHWLILTHCGLVKPYGNLDLGQHWFRQWLVAWRHQAITWANVHLSSIRPISQVISSHSIYFFIQVGP